MRLESVLPQMVYLDQSGFVQGRQGFHSTRRLLIIFFEKSGLPDHSVLSLDAEKVFYRIEWQYLFDVLERMGVSGNFLKWVQLLYSNLQAELLSKGLVSMPFRLNQGTRQGCPLSPLLFILAIDALAMPIRKHADIKHPFK